MLTLLLIPCIASGSDEINKGDSDYGKNFGLAATQEICEYLEKNKEGISETTIEAAKVLGSDAAKKISSGIDKWADAIVTISTILIIGFGLKSIRQILFTN